MQLTILRLRISIFQISTEFDWSRRHQLENPSETIIGETFELSSNKLCFNHLKNTVFIKFQEWLSSAPGETFKNLLTVTWYNFFKSRFNIKSSRISWIFFNFLCIHHAFCQTGSNWSNLAAKQIKSEYVGIYTYKIKTWFHLELWNFNHLDASLWLKWSADRGPRLVGSSPLIHL